MRSAVAVLLVALLLALLGSGVVWRMSRDRAERDRAEREAVRVARVENQEETLRVEEETTVIRREALFGLVTDMSGNSVAGARVKSGDAQTTSGEDGAYRIEAVSPLEVSAEGYAPLHVTGGPFKGERDLVLTRGGTVRAVVVDNGTGKPVVGVTVRLTGDRITDANGVATFANVSSHGFHHGRGTRLGELQLIDPGSVAAPVDVNMPGEGETVEHRVVRYAAATVVGRVVNKKGTPVRDAFVNGQAVDAEGRYRLTVAAGRGLVTVEARQVGINPARHKVHVTAGRTTAVPDFVFEDPIVTRVTVVDASDAPVAGALVSFRAAGEGAVTGEDGRAVLYGSRKSWVHVRPRVHACCRVRARRDIRIVVYRGHPIAGQVVWKDGKPVADALVRHAHGARTRTDDEGLFRFGHVMGVGEIAASIVYGGNYGRVTVVGRVKDVPAGATGVRIELDREDFAPVATIRGTVEDDVTGQKLARFRVKFYKDDRVLVSRKIGVGKFEADLAEGEWTMFVGGPGYIGRNERIRAVPGVPIPPQRLLLQPR